MNCYLRDDLCDGHSALLGSLQLEAPFLDHVHEDLHQLGLGEVREFESKVLRKP